MVEAGFGEETACSSSGSRIGIGRSWSSSAGASTTPGPFQYGALLRRLFDGLLRHPAGLNSSRAAAPPLQRLACWISLGGAPSGASPAAPSQSFRRAGIDLEVEEEAGLDRVLRFLSRSSLLFAGSPCNFLIFLDLHVSFQRCIRRSNIGCLHPPLYKKKYCTSLGVCKSYVSVLVVIILANLGRFTVYPWACGDFYGVKPNSAPDAVRTWNCLFLRYFISERCGDIQEFSVHSILLNLLKYSFLKILYHNREFLI
jgi:hypothetical protein